VHLEGARVSVWSSSRELSLIDGVPVAVSNGKWRGAARARSKSNATDACQRRLAVRRMCVCAGLLAEGGEEKVHSAVYLPRRRAHSNSQAVSEQASRVRGHRRENERVSGCAESQCLIERSTPRSRSKWSTEWARSIRPNTGSVPLDHSLHTVSR